MLKTTEIIQWRTNDFGSGKIFNFLKLHRSFCWNKFYVFSWYFAANGKHCSTLPSPASSATNLKSSLSKTSSLKKSFNYKFETDSNLQQIVKQKRENCLQVDEKCYDRWDNSVWIFQNGLSLSRESLADVFDDDSAVSQVWSLFYNLLLSL